MIRKFKKDCSSVSGIENFMTVHCKIVGFCSFGTQERDPSMDTQYTGLNYNNSHAREGTQGFLRLKMCKACVFACRAFSRITDLSLQENTWKNRKCIPFCSRLRIVTNPAFPASNHTGFSCPPENFHMPCQHRQPEEEQGWLPFPPGTVDSAFSFSSWP